MLLRALRVLSLFCTLTQFYKILCLVLDRRLLMWILLDILVDIIIKLIPKKVDLLSCLTHVVILGPLFNLRVLPSFVFPLMMLFLIAICTLTVNFGANPIVASLLLLLL